MVTLEPPRSMPGTADPWDGLGFKRAAVMGFVRRGRRAVGMTGEVDVLLAPDATLRRLNREFRGKDKATDVLSFPAVEGMPGNRAGDLAVSLQTAARQADRFGHTVFEEVCILILHGLLHLAGLDHEVDGGEMAAREAELRERLRLPVGLIARVGTRGQGVGTREQGIGNRKSKDRSRFPSGMTNQEGMGKRLASGMTSQEGKGKSGNAMGAMLERNVRKGTAKKRVVAR